MSDLKTYQTRLATGAINAFGFVPIIFYIGFQQETLLWKWVLILIAIILFGAEIYLIYKNIPPYIALSKKFNPERSENS